MVFLNLENVSLAPSSSPLFPLDLMLDGSHENLSIYAEQGDKFTAVLSER